jgi:hypothetical protein
LHPASSRAASAKEIPLSANDAFDLLKSVQHLAQFRSIHFDPATADEVEAIGTCKQPSDLGFR